MPGSYIMGIVASALTALYRDVGSCSPNEASGWTM